MTSAFKPKVSAGPGGEKRRGMERRFSRWRFTAGRSQPPLPHSQIRGRSGVSFPFAARRAVHAGRTRSEACWGGCARPDYGGGLWSSGRCDGERDVHTPCLVCVCVCACAARACLGVSACLHVCAACACRMYPCDRVCVCARVSCMCAGLCAPVCTRLVHACVRVCPACVNTCACAARGAPRGRCPSRRAVWAVWAPSRLQAPCSAAVGPAVPGPVTHWSPQGLTG